MDDPSENSLKTICCTCLSTNRLLDQLYKIKDGINNLYLLLSQDPEAYKEGFYKDVTSLRICWECNAKMKTIMLFRAQACTAQKLLTSIVDGQVQPEAKSMSRLRIYLKTEFDATVVFQDDENDDNFIDCGLAIDEIKSENDSDTPLSEFQDIKSNINREIRSPLISDIKSLSVKEKKIKRHKKKKKVKTTERDKELFSMETMSQSEMQDFGSNLKMSAEYIESVYKCGFCMKIFKDQIELNNHNADFHTEKPDHMQCDICSCFIKTASFFVHHSEHYQRYKCNYCQFSSCILTDIHRHIEKCVNIKMINEDKTSKTSAKCKTQSKSVNGYPCTECNQSFNNKNQRWKHVQRCHRDGYKCSQCDKKFAFKSNLIRHETIHNTSLPREECPTCKKAVRCDLMKIHVRTHSQRENYNCIQCDRWFISKASYQHHLNYTTAHAVHDICPYKCDTCGKGYRTRAQLKDHMNYQHLGTTDHKCPICGKGLATPRCVTRHVKRAHQGIKESPKDKICPQCGKAFRDNKSLRDHCNIHSSCRPWACEVCGKTFTQSASLYEHRKRTHHIYPGRKK